MWVGSEARTEKKRKDRLCKDKEGSRMMQKLWDKQNDGSDFTGSSASE